MTSTITREHLLHLLKLSKLEIPVEQELFYLHSLNKLMDTLNELQNVVIDTTEVAAYPKENLKLREDIAVVCTNQAACELQAPKSLSHFFIVPQVIE